MTPKPAWVWKAWLTVALIGALTVLVAGYVYFRITAVVEFEPRHQPNALDAKEAVRKLKLYAEASNSSRRGFIRISEVELNSYLKELYFSATKTNAPKADSRECELLKSEAVLLNHGVIWSAWLKKNVLGKTVHLFWERQVELRGQPENWVFQTKGMRLGKMEVPPFFWDYVQDELGEADRVLADQFHWLARVPTLEIKTNDTSSSPELRLYTYRVPGMLSKTKP